VNQQIGVRCSTRLAVPLAGLLLVVTVTAGMRPAPYRQARDLLWQIGKLDQDSPDLALAPGHYRKFQRDGFFVVAPSDPRRDWPYTQPGSDDAWAGMRPHTLTVVFALRAAPAGANCALLFALVDTQRGAPPALDITINGNDFWQKFPRGIV
jgi:hypothetical protein